MTSPALSLLSPHEVDELLSQVLGDREARDTAKQWLPYVLLATLAGAAWVAQQLSLSVILAERDLTVQRLLESREEAMRSITATTRERLRIALTNAPPGVTASDLATIVRYVFEKASTVRAPQIALMEAGGAWEAGGHRESVLQIVPARLWITQRDLRVRVLHVVLDGQCRKVGEAFQTPSGHALMFPRDPEGELEMIINCRCLSAPLARGCESQARHFAHEAQRRAYWKTTNAALAVEERRMMRAVRQTFSRQREAVLAGLAHRLR